MGFSPAGFNLIVIFSDENDFKDIVAANPAMTAIIEDSDHNIYIAGVKAGASLLRGTTESHPFPIQR